VLERSGRFDGACPTPIGSAIARSAAPTARARCLHRGLVCVARRRPYARERIKELLQRRIDTQPLNPPNRSVFRNPDGDHAARLIESCGLKGRTIGGARVSEKHANFIVNPGGAGSAADIEALIEEVRATVRARTASTRPEVQIIGEMP
jgi:UDP-N-acetylenolpyruvoylglucosamine reductase